MKNCLRIVVFSLVCFFAMPLPAADWAAVEISAGPSLMRISDEELVGVQLGFNLNRWQHFSLMGTFGYHSSNQQISFEPSPAVPKHHPHGHSEGNHHDQHNEREKKPKAPSVSVSTGIGDVYTYLGGLRVRRKILARMAGFAQAQVGGARVGDQNHLAFAGGGGAQVSISQRFAVEARVEYLRIRVGGNHLDDGLQATVGIVVRFGPWWGGYRKP